MARSRPLTFIFFVNSGSCNTFWSYASSQRRYNPIAHVCQQNTFKLSAGHQCQINNVVAHAWRESTADRYSSHLKDYLWFCKSKCIPQGSQLPASADILCLYVALMARRLAGRIATSKILGLHCWHIQNNLLWPTLLWLNYAIKGIDNLKPVTSKRIERPPVSCEMLQHLHSSLDHLDLHDICIWAMALTTFWGQIWLGEILPKREQGFDKVSLPQ